MYIDETPRTLDVIFTDSLKKFPAELKDIPMYRVVRPGELELSSGKKKKSNDVLLFDVTNMDEQFKEKYASVIVKMEVEKLNTFTVEKEKKIILLPVDSETYETLSKAEKNALGYDFHNVIVHDDGYNVIPIVSARILPDNLCIKLKLSTIDESLLSKISDDVVELELNELGLYRESTGIGQKSTRL